MKRRRFYILQGGVRKGPYSKDRLYEKYHDGAIGSTTLCCERRALKENPFASWTPLSDLLDYIYPGRRQTVDRVNLSDGAPSRQINTAAALIAYAGIIVGIYFLYFFGDTPTGPSAELAKDSKEFRDAALLHTVFRAGGLVAAAVLIVGGSLALNSRPPR